MDPERVSIVRQAPTLLNRIVGARPAGDVSNPKITRTVRNASAYGQQTRLYGAAVTLYLFVEQLVRCFQQFVGRQAYFIVGIDEIENNLARLIDYIDSRDCQSVEIGRAHV